MDNKKKVSMIVTLELDVDLVKEIESGNKQAILSVEEATTCDFGKVCAVEFGEGLTIMCRQAVPAPTVLDIVGLDLNQHIELKLYQELVIRLTDAIRNNGSLYSYFDEKTYMHIYEIRTTAAEIIKRMREIK